MCIEAYIHKLTGVLFYCLGSSFLLLHLARRNNWLSNDLAFFIFDTFDLSFIFIALLYGGTSVHLSMRRKDHKATATGIIIAIVLCALFGYLALLNYWTVLGLPVQS